MKSNLKMSMKEYISSLKEANVRDATKKLSKMEMTKYRKIAGKLMWLAENSRMDKAFGALQLAKNSKDFTIKYLKTANSLIKKAKSKESVVVSTLIGKEEDIISMELVMFLTPVEIK